MTIYDQDLDKNAANFAALTPLNFIERSASVYSDQLSIIHGEQRYTWSQTYARCCLLASALSTLGIGKGDTVAVMGANTPETFEAHFGVPMIGAVLNALNVRLDAKAHESGRAFSLQLEALVGIESTAKHGVAMQRHEHQRTSS